jgi:GDP-L-fucose synthase
MKKILILGVTGFIGKTLKEYYVNNKKYDLYYPTSKELNLLDEEKVIEYLRINRFDVIIHAANYGIGQDKSKDENKILENILRMFLNLQKCNNLYGKLIHLGSGAEYNKEHSIVSVRECEIGKTIPVDQYGLAKYAINEITQKSENIYNLRLFGVFGKYEYWPVKFISNICCKAVKGLPLTIRQNVVFDYLWIDDFCEIMDWFIENNPKYHTYNITTKNKIDLLTICNKIKDISGKDLPIYVCKEGMGFEYTGDNERLINELGGVEFTPIDKSLRELYLWYLNNEDKIDLMSLFYR